MFARVLLFTFLIALVVGGAVHEAPAQVLLSSNDIPTDTMISLRRDGLSVTVNADGRVAVEGQTFDYDILAIRVEIDRAELTMLVSEALRIQYFSLNDRYYDLVDGCVSLRSTATFIAVTTSITLNGASKTISRSHQCVEADGSSYPRDLVAFEHQLETIVNLHRR